MPPVVVILSMVVLLAMTKAEFLKYSQRKLRKLDLTDPKQEKSDAALVNFDQTIEFLAAKMQRLDGVAQFDQNPEPDPSRHVYNHPKCNNFVGIYIQELDEFFCKAKSIYVGFYQYPGYKDAIRFSITFSLYGMRTLVLQVPIFKKPCKVKSFDEQELQDWANEEEVGIVPPVPLKTLKSSWNIKKMAVEFLWLSNLLTYGVTKSKESSQSEGTQSEIEIYITRPVVVRNYYMEVCRRLTSFLKNQYAESEGSNTPDNFSYEESSSE